VTFKEMVSIGLVFFALVEAVSVEFDATLDDVVEEDVSESLGGTFSMVPSVSSAEEVPPKRPFNLPNI
jgi:hypothetical protein